MAISVGDTLPDANVFKIGADGHEEVSLSDLASSGKVIVFALPGAFTGTCTSAHVPSFMRTAEQFAEKGVNTILCIAVNDPFVMKAWSDSTGAGAAGVTMLADPASDFVKSVGMDFDAPPVGFYGRSKRFAMYIEDGVVKVLHAEESPGVCESSGGEAMLAAI